MTYKNVEYETKKKEIKFNISKLLKIHYNCKSVATNFEPWYQYSATMYTMSLTTISDHEILGMFARKQIPVI